MTVFSGVVGQIQEDFYLFRLYVFTLRGRRGGGFISEDRGGFISEGRISWKFEDFISCIQYLWFNRSGGNLSYNW